MIESLLSLGGLLAIVVLFGYSIYAIDQYLDALTLKQKLALAFTGYISGSWCFIHLSLPEFAVDRYEHMAIAIFSVIPAGSIGLTFTVGIGAIMNHHLKRVDLLATPFLVMTLVSMLGARTEMLSAQGLDHYGHYSILEDRARRNVRDGDEALEIILTSGRKFEIDEPFNDNYRLIAYFKSANRKLQEIDRHAVANGNLNLDDESLFRTGDGEDLVFEQQLAARIVNALAERSQGKFDSAATRRWHWSNLISSADDYAGATTPAFASKRYFVSLERTNQIGRIWQQEIERARKSNPDLNQEISEAARDIPKAVPEKPTPRS